MVRLKSLSLTNFMNVEQLDLEFEDKVLMMITGANGEGKSTLVAALALALVDYRKGDSYRDYVRRGTEEAVIDLHASIHGYPIHYLIKLSNRKYGSPTEKTIQYRDKTYINSECKILMDELNVEYLEHAMFLYQNSNGIVDLKPAERAKLLKKLFHFEFNDHVALLRKQLEEENNQLKESDIRFEELGKQEFIPLELKDDTPEKELRAKKKALSKKKGDLEAINHFDSSSILALEKDLGVARDNYNARKGWRDNLLKSQEDKERRISSLKQELGSLDTTEVEGDLSFLEEDLSSTEDMLREAERSSYVLGNRVDDLEKQLSVASTGVCNSCGHAVDEKHVGSLERALEEMRESYEQCSTRASNLKEEVIKAKEAINAIREYHRVLKKEEDLNEQISSLEDQKLDVESSLKEGTIALNLAEKTLEEQKLKSSQIDKLREDLKRKQALEGEVFALEQEIEDNMHSNSINAERRAMNANLEIKKKEHEELVSSLSRKINNHSIQAEVLKKSLNIFENEFPNFIILKTCAQLESYINLFIQKVFPYMSIKLRPSRSGVEFFYVAKSSEEDWLSVKMASGAQAAVLSLAWRVAVAKLYGVNALVLDEADASADNETAQIIYQFIAELDTFDQLIFVSHKKEAMNEIASRVDNLVCYNVQDGEFVAVDAFS